MANKFSDRSWRIEQYMIDEAEAKAAEGDEKLDNMIQSMNDYTLQLTTTLGSMPNYVDFIRKPNDPAKSPEQNNIDKQTVVNALNNLKDNTILMNKMYAYFKKYISQKYNFNEE
jgi:hypothetical protein|tara:strand:+ start:5695 stop:6036 length:342 start_codon:yes stop_codon:yes gene_type:complete